MSPEQQERSEDELSTGYLNEKIDTYALGNILYKIAVGNSPWKVSSMNTFMSMSMHINTFILSSSHISLFSQYDSV